MIVRYVEAVQAALVAALLVGAGAGLGCDSDSGAIDTSGPDIPTPIEDAGPSEVDNGPAEPIDYDSNPGVAPRYDLTSMDWTATPWPTDRLRTEDGTVDFGSFPSNGLELVEDYVDHATASLGGFGLSSCVYAQFDGPLDLESMPDPATTLGDPRAAVQLVNVDPDSPRYDERVPLQFGFYGEGPDPYYIGNTLAVRPVFGFPLEEASRYCLIVTRAVTDANGKWLRHAPGFPAAIDIEDSLAPLSAWLPTSALEPRDIAVASCFTTLDATGELRRVGAFLDGNPLPEITSLQLVEGFGVYHEFRGTFEMPNFQHGDKPYQFEGGGMQWDAATGDPVIAEMEDVRFKLLIPNDFFTPSMPEQGWETVLYSHGTGGDWTSCEGIRADNTTKVGMAMICIDQPLHGIRGDGAAAMDLYLLVFNVLNPPAARMNFRQSTIDNMVLARMIEASVFDMVAGSAGFEDDVVLNANRIHFFGHSHGGLSGALLVGIEPRIYSAVLSGAGGPIIETILQRKDVGDISEAVRLAGGIPQGYFDGFHPLLTLVQSLIEVTDPTAYAPYWLNPATGGIPKHVFMTEGTLDAQVPSVITESLAAAAGLPIVDPEVSASLPHALRGLGRVQIPVSSNVFGSDGKKYTAGLAQWEGGDHWTAFNVEEAVDMWWSFFRGQIDYGTPVIDL